MSEKIKAHETAELYPQVLVKCQDCGEEFTGVVGPVDLESGESYPLVQYVWPNRLLNQLLSHHYTVRGFSSGHNSFDVFQGDNFVGRAKISSRVQMFVKA